MTQEISKTAYITTLIMAICAIIVGHLWVGQIERLGTLDRIYRGQVTEITSDITFEGFNTRVVHSEVMLETGQVVRGERAADGDFVMHTRFPEVGDRVIIRYDHLHSRYDIVEFERLGQVALLGGLLMLLIIAFGRGKGFNGVISLVLICLFIFFVFIPGIFSGMNLYVLGLMVCLYATVVTLILVLGLNKKSYSAMGGASGALAMTGVSIWVIDRLLGLTGMFDSETMGVIALGEAIDLRGLLFAGILIGSSGAVMDVSTSIASSLWEIERLNKQSFKDHVISGFNIGRDTLGTMLNTLILAYIGGYLGVVMFVATETNSVVELLNQERIIVEFVRAIVGSFGIFLAIPVTTFLGAWVFTRDKYRVFDL